MPIRSLGIEDYDAVMDLWRRSGLSSLRPAGRDGRDAFLRQLQACTPTRGTCRSQTALGLYNHDQLVGVVVVTHDGRKGWINRLAVDPNHRLRGHAKELISAAEEVLKAQGIHVMAALIRRENDVSIALFQKAGYKLHDNICYLSKRDSTEA